MAGGAPGRGRDCFSGPATRKIPLPRDRQFPLKKAMRNILRIGPRVCAVDGSALTQALNGCAIADAFKGGKVRECWNAAHAGP